MKVPACLSAAAALLLASCIAAPGPPAPSRTPPVPPSPTITVAFPTIVPSSTWTPGATPSPTAGLDPAPASELLYDPMDNPAAWELPTTASGAAALTDGQLTLSIHAPRTYHTAHRPQPILGDFYAEVDMRTEVCTPGDELGLTARGGGLTEQYRFLVGCDGTARITRVLDEGSRALTLRVESPAIRRGAPALNHLAIWLHGLDLKFLVNGEEVLSARDAALSQGILGVVARAGTGGQVSASFDDLRVYNLSDASAQPTGVPGAPSPPP